MNLFPYISLDICIFRQLMTVTLSQWLMSFSRRLLSCTRKKLQYVSNIFVDLMKITLLFRASNCFLSNFCFYISTLPRILKPR